MEKWVAPSVFMTFFMALLSLALIPIAGMTNAPSFKSFAMWMLFMGTLSGVMLFAYFFRMMLDGVSSPIATALKNFDRRAAAMAFIGCVITGLNFVAYSWLKPLLGQVVPYTADPWIAELEHSLLGFDAWTKLDWFGHKYADVLYHKFWFAWLTIIVLAVIVRKPSVQKDALVVSYVALWAILGPLVHVMMPAGGPVFYNEFGLGTRFEMLRQPALAASLSQYLWDGFTARAFNPGGGISAMPSLHIATMVWTVIATRQSWLVVPAVVTTVYMWLGSIYLGWHYALDGLVGAVGALAIFLLIRAMFQKRSNVHAYLAN